MLSLLSIVVLLSVMHVLDLPVAEARRLADPTKDETGQMLSQMEEIEAVMVGFPESESVPLDDCFTLDDDFEGSDTMKWSKQGKTVNVEAKDGVLSVTGRSRAKDGVRRFLHKNVDGCLLQLGETYTLSFKVAQYNTAGGGGSDCAVDGSKCPVALIYTRFDGRPTIKQNIVTAPQAADGEMRTVEATFVYAGDADPSLPVKSSFIRIQGPEEAVDIEIDEVRLRSADSAAPPPAPVAAPTADLPPVQTCALVQSPEEQYMLEQLNRARADPQGEADLLLGGKLNEGSPYCAPISTTPKQPLAWNALISDASLTHSQDMVDKNFFSHNGSDGRRASDRVTDAGYTWRTVGENLSIRVRYPTAPAFTATAGILHNDLFIDSGVSGRGHRCLMMDEEFEEIGVSILADSSFASPIFGTPVRDWKAVLVTQNFGAPRPRDPDYYIMGTVFTDTVEDDDFYTVGEGIEDARVVISRDGVPVAHLSTCATGAYQVRLPAGTYDISVTADFNGDGSETTMDATSISHGSQNTKVDFYTV